MECAGRKGKQKSRRNDNESGEGRSKKIRSREAKDDTTEEQVEEFFAILRRMQEAVKYFEKESGEGWRSALEAEVVAVAAGEAEGSQIENGTLDTKPTAEVETGVLDLNVIPEVESTEM